MYQLEDGASLNILSSTYAFYEHHCWIGEALSFVGFFCIPQTLKIKNL